MLHNIFTIIMIILLILYIVTENKSHKQNVKVYIELLRMNDLLIEQNEKIWEYNSELTKANQNLNRVIIHVCSKSVRDRKSVDKEEQEADNETDSDVEKQGNES